MLHEPTPPGEAPTDAAPEMAASAPDTALDTPQMPAFGAVDEVLDEVALLDGLESDLIAVERAIEALDRVTADGAGGHAAVASIEAAVSESQFGSALAPAADPGDVTDSA